MQNIELRSLKAHTGKEECVHFFYSCTCLQWFLHQLHVIYRQGDLRLHYFIFTATRIIRSVKVCRWGPWHSCSTQTPCGHDDKGGGGGAESHDGLTPDNGNVPAAGKVLEWTCSSQNVGKVTQADACKRGWWCPATSCCELTWEQELHCWEVQCLPLCLCRNPNWLTQDRNYYGCKWGFNR